MQLISFRGIAGTTFDEAYPQIGSEIFALLVIYTLGDFQNLRENYPEDNPGNHIIY